MNDKAAELCKKSSSFVGGQDASAFYAFQQIQKAESIQAAIDSHNALMGKPTPKVITVDNMRKAGQDAYNFQGSTHYKSSTSIEPVDLMNSNGTLEGFSIGSIIKYAYRYVVSRNDRDLEKILDFAFILYGKGRDINGKK